MFGSQQPMQKLPPINQQIQDQRYHQPLGQAMGPQYGAQYDSNGSTTININSQPLPGMSSVAPATSQLPPLNSIYSQAPVPQATAFTQLQPLSQQRALSHDDIDRGVRKVRHRKRSIISTGSRSRSRSQSRSRRASRYGDMLFQDDGNSVSNKSNNGSPSGSNGSDESFESSAKHAPNDKDGQPLTMAKSTVSRRRGPWSPEEDKKLLSLVDAFGGEKNLNWVKISQMLGTRTAKQARERYHQNLKPSLNKSPITPEEGRVIESLVAKYGKRWAEIARHLNGRSDNAIKNWWNGGANRRRRAREAQARKEATVSLTRQSQRVPFVVQSSSPHFNTSIFGSAGASASVGSSSSGSVNTGVGSDANGLEPGQSIHLPPLRYGRSASVDMRSNLGLAQEPMSSLRKQTLLGAGPNDGVLRRHSVATVNPMGGQFGNQPGNPMANQFGNPIISPLSNLSSRNSSITEYSAFGLPGNDGNLISSRRASAFAIPPSSAAYISPPFAPRLSFSSNSQIPPMNLEESNMHQQQGQQQSLPGLRRDIFKKNFTLQSDESSGSQPSMRSKLDSKASNSVSNTATTHSGSSDKDKMSISFLT